MKRRVHDRFNLEKLSEHHIYTMTDESCFDYQWWKAQDRWHLIDACSHKGARSVLPSYFPIKAANTLIIDMNNHIAFDLPNLQDQISLRLRSLSISEWGMERDARSIAFIPSQCRIHEWSQPIAKQTTNDATPKIVDSPLNLILPCAYPQYVIINFGVIYH